MNFEAVSLKLQVRPNDLDSLGHVNNATVLEYLEAGRWAWLKHHSLHRGQQIIPIVTRIEVNYRKEILLGEVVVITKPEESEESFHYQVTFCQSIKTLKDDTSAIAADARVQVGFIDSVERTLRTLQEFLDENKHYNDGN